MIKKIQSYLNVVLVLFVIFGIIYFLINLVIDMFRVDIQVKKDSLSEYTTQDKLVTSYSLFNMLEECTSNLYETLINENYSEVYKIVGENTRKQYSKEEIIWALTGYAKDILGVENLTQGHTIWLNKAYELERGYIAEIKSTYTEESMYIIFNLDLYDLTYTIDLIT